MKHKRSVEDDGTMVGNSYMFRKMVSQIRFNPNLMNIVQFTRMTVVNFHH